MTVTWNPSDIGPNITLSGGNLIATGTPGVNSGLGRTNKSFSSGKLYFEAAWVVDAFSGQSSQIGWANSLCQSGSDLGNGAPNGTNSVAVRAGGIIFDSTFGQGGGTFAVTERVGFAFDIDDFLFWWRDVTANGAWLPNGDPATLSGGYSSTSDTNFKPSVFTGPYFPAFTLGNNNDQIQAFFASGSLLGPIPRGFAPVDPVLIGPLVDFKLNYRRRGQDVVAY